MIFENHSLWRLIPDLAHHRDQWAFSKISPHLRPTAIRAIIGLLQDLNDSHIKSISDHFGTTVTIDKFSQGSVRSVEFKIYEPPDLSNFSFYTGFSSTREGDTIKMTFWR